MLRIVLPLLICALATPVYGQAEVKLGPDTNEHPFQCGAAFAIMAKVYQEAGDNRKSEDYRKKFHKLAIEAKAIFEKSHRSKDDANAYMQKHVDSLASIAERDSKLVIAFARDCGDRFPN